MRGLPQISPVNRNLPLFTWQNGTFFYCGPATSLCIPLLYYFKTTCKQLFQVCSYLHSGFYFLKCRCWSFLIHISHHNPLHTLSALAILSGGWRTKGDMDLQRKLSSRWGRDIHNILTHRFWVLRMQTVPTI